MPSALIEIASEEIPARMQARAEEDLRRLLGGFLTDAGFSGFGLRSFSTPRRLAVEIDDLPARQADRIDERKGPRVGAPQGAIAGFLRSAGLDDISEAEIVPDDKGGFYLAKTRKAGLATTELLPKAIASLLAAFPWPKSMRSGAESRLWVRPITNVLAWFDDAALDLSELGLPCAPHILGHRFLAPAPALIEPGFDYRAALRARFVLADRAERRARIQEQAEAICAGKGLALRPDEALLDEVTGLVEWPHALLGDIAPEFLSLPAEVIATSMRTHQKFFSVNDPATGRLAPHFVAIANIIPKDGGAKILAGNQKVLTARLKDAAYFWALDKASPLDAPDRREKLQKLVFHEKLGTMSDKVDRIADLAQRLAPAFAVDPAMAARAATLCKLDLVTEMVGEFPELQGVMGGYYAQAHSAPAAIAAAIRDHYRPLGPKDPTPDTPLGKLIALADKLDTLNGFWSIGAAPTGSSDPFALRRAALGIMRILIDGQTRLPLSVWTQPPVKAFIFDRLKVWLRDSGLRPDIIEAAFAGARDDVFQLFVATNALAAALDAATGANLVAGLKRAGNILRAEEKRDATTFAPSSVDPTQFAHPLERILAAAIADAQPRLKAALDADQPADALAALAALRQPIDAFFADLVVNADDPDIRSKRLGLLANIRALASEIADFSKIEG
ncbi:MAG TPA: glycine--tRNA ligase subunit beta [Hyphomonadaceae bacterium]|nr:glycine--tRNA ligase subunit beta [Hyphomonadaceae bacterium]